MPDMKGQTGKESEQHNYNNASKNKMTRPGFPDRRMELHFRLGEKFDMNSEYQFSN